MGFAWNPFGVLGFVPLVTSWAVAAVVLAAGGGRAQNRRLALFLVLYGLALAFFDGVRRFATTYDDAYAAVAVGVALMLALLPIHLLFLATLDAPLARPLRGRRATIVLGGAAVGLFLLGVAAPAAFAVPFETNIPGAAAYGNRGGPLFSWFVGAWALEFLFALAVAWSAFRAAPPGSIARGRARAYLLAFGTHDLLWLGELAFTLFTLWAGLFFTPWVAWEGVIMRATVPALFALLLAYALLRWQLFDLDLRIKRGISRGTLVAIFLVTFVVVAEVLQNWLSETQGYFVGGAAAAVMVLAIRPLERAADRIAHAALPAVSGSPEYLAYRKLQVYRATLEGALQDGAVSDRERAMLDALARELGIRAEDARAVEAEVASSSSSS